MVNENKTFLFRIKHQAKNVFQKDFESKLTFRDCSEVQNDTSIQKDSEFYLAMRGICSKIQIQKQAILVDSIHIRGGNSVKHCFTNLLKRVYYIREDLFPLVYSLRKEFSPKGTKSLHYRVDPFSEGTCE